MSMSGTLATDGDASPRRRAILVELGTSHGDCLYSQALILGMAGWTVELICSPELEPYIPGLAPHVERIERLEPDDGVRSHWRRVLRTHRRIRDANPALVVLNSAQGRSVRDFFLLPHSHSVPFFGILHQVDKLTESFTQRLITPHMHGYFLLDDHLRSLALPEASKPVASFYPIFFPELPEPTGGSHGADQSLPDEKSADDIWICVPGSVEFKRRDYRALWELGDALAAYPRTRFILLGRCDSARPDGARLRQELASRGLTERFRLFDDFVPPATFHAWLRRCDLVMPLLHAKRPEFEYYENRRVSFAFHLAAGRRIPLLVDRYFERFADYRGNALFYDPNRMATALNDLPGRLNDVASHVFLDSKWTLAEQSRRYLGLIERGDSRCRRSRPRAL